MRLREEEKELIREWWKSDMNIVLERSRYRAELESNVIYDHSGEGADRKRGDKRGMFVFPENGGYMDKTYLKRPHENPFDSPEEAIEWLDEQGSLLKEVDNAKH